MSRTQGCTMSETPNIDALRYGRTRPRAWDDGVIEGYDVIHARYTHYLDAYFGMVAALGIVPRDPTDAALAVAAMRDRIVQLEEQQVAALTPAPIRVITDLIDDMREAVREIENGCHPWARHRVYREIIAARNAALNVIANVPAGTITTATNVLAAVVALCDAYDAVDSFHGDYDSVEYADRKARHDTAETVCEDAVRAYRTVTP